jgi:hypothetical protein
MGKGPVLAPLLVLLTACGSSEPTSTPKWFTTCGDPVCHGYQKPSGVSLCTSTETAGSSCGPLGTKCDPVDPCNALLVCSASDPKTQTGGCPVSRASFKSDIHYLTREELEAYYAELKGIRLATYRYRAAGERKHLGFLIDDQKPGVTIDPDRDQVDLYSYTSLAVAALQVQAERIAALEGEVDRLRRELEAKKK